MVCIRFTPAANFGTGLCMSTIDWQPGTDGSKRDRGCVNTTSERVATYATKNVEPSKHFSISPAKAFTLPVR